MNYQDLKQAQETLLNIDFNIFKVIKKIGGKKIKKMSNINNGGCFYGRQEPTNYEIKKRKNQAKSD